MSSTARREHVVMLTPGATGQDGISSVARSAVAALEAGQHFLQVLSLHDDPGSCLSHASILASGGSKRRFVLDCGRQALGRHAPSLVLCMHLHLAPLMTPWLARGARGFIFLHGIEAWVPLRRLSRLVVKLPRVRFLSNSAHTWREFLRVNPGHEGRLAGLCLLGVGEAAPVGRLPTGIHAGFALAVGRLHEGYKGHDELLEVWPDLLSSVPAARLVIAGDGPDRARLEEKAIRLGLCASVRFLGRVSDGEMEALYRSCAFFSLPSQGEGFGLVYLEAMRAGKACLAGPGAPEEVVLHEQTGLVVDPRDRSQLRAALQRLFTEEATRVTWGEAGRRRQAEVFTQEAFSERLRHSLNVE